MLRMSSLCLIFEIMYQIDHTKTVLQNLVGLANEGFNPPAGNKLQNNDFTYRTPVVITPGAGNGNKNTQLVLAGDYTRGIYGRTTIQYNRISLANNRPSIGDHLTIYNADTAAAILQKIAEKWRIVSSEVSLSTTAFPVKGKSKTIQVVPNTNSVIYAPGSNLSVTLINRDEVLVYPSSTLFYLDAFLYSIGTTSFVDSAGGGALTTGGSTIVTNAVAGRFNDREIRFSTINDYIRIPNARIPNILTGDFTIEMWLRPTSQLASDTRLFTQWRQSTVAERGFEFFMTNGSLSLIWGPAGTGTLLSGGGTVTGAWRHLAVTREGSTFRLWSNGTQTATAQSSAVNATGIVTDYVIGGRFNSSNVVPDTTISGLTADIEQLAVHNYAKYSAAFTPESVF